MTIIHWLAVGFFFGSLSSGSAPAAAARPEVLPFIADDYSRALTEARSKKLPIFLEAWAPW